MLAFELCADNNLNGPVPLWLRGPDVRDFQKPYEMWTRQTTAHFSTMSQSISDKLRPREATLFLDVVDIGLSLCTVEF